ncbi:hypothetical protein [Gordonia soli]|uniref:DUF1579 domain-containing protein n=1 Tax=Gordonia soli NBRC 108243 TaxID=1223545 RepID=M0QNS9_9ACTN|nr:hypothetical protein [Gordonia soli]GAC70064.1 hypothetical protein GS4_32_00080 [Gordonia soli NBRC 108243]
MTPTVDDLPLTLGRWHSTGTVLDESGRATAHIDGTDVYTALPGGAWIAHEVDVHIGSEHTVAHELIGGAHPDGGWSMYAFDESPTPGVMRLSAEAPDLLLLSGDGVRSWFSHRAGPDHMTTEWERVVDGIWIPWMSMRFDRI